MRFLAVLILLLVVASCGHDYVTRPPVPAAPDSTVAPCEDDDCDDDEGGNR